MYTCFVSLEQSISGLGKYIKETMFKKHYLRAIIISKAVIQKVPDMYARAHKLSSSYRPVL
jgi:hypothetical protein